MQIHYCEIDGFPNLYIPNDLIRIAVNRFDAIRAPKHVCPFRCKEISDMLAIHMEFVDRLVWINASHEIFVKLSVLFSDYQRLVPQHQATLQSAATALFCCGCSESCNYSKRCHRHSARLLRANGVKLNIETNEHSFEFHENLEFSPQSKFVLELALHLVRRQSQKSIGTEHILWGLIRLVETDKTTLSELFQRYGIDAAALNNQLTETV